MSFEKHKYVIVIDHDLSVGLTANTAAVLSATIGRLAEGIIGPDLKDESRVRHLGITTIPIAILRADAERIRQIRSKAAQIDSLMVVDFCNVAQSCRNYEDYQAKLATTYEEDLRYLGIALFGKYQDVVKLTGNLGLLR